LKKVRCTTTAVEDETFLLRLTTNFSSLATIGKNQSVLKEQKGFLAHPKWPERFLGTQKNIFLNKNTMKYFNKKDQNGREKSL
jgi:hypothetical protein